MAWFHILIFTHYPLFIFIPCLFIILFSMFMAEDLPRFSACMFLVAMTAIYLSR